MAEDPTDAASPDAPTQPIGGTEQHVVPVRGRPRPRVGQDERAVAFRVIELAWFREALTDPDEKARTISAIKDAKHFPELRAIVAPFVKKMPKELRDPGNRRRWRTGLAAVALVGLGAASSQALSDDGRVGDLEELLRQQQAGVSEVQETLVEQQDLLERQQQQIEQLQTQRPSPGQAARIAELEQQRAALQQEMQTMQLQVRELQEQVGRLSGSSFFDQLFEQLESPAAPVAPSGTTELAPPAGRAVATSYSPVAAAHSVAFLSRAANGGPVL